MDRLAIYKRDILRKKKEYGVKLLVILLVFSFYTVRMLVRMGRRE
jgi:hypothetical protein